MVETKRAIVDIEKVYVVKGELATYFDGKNGIHNKISKEFETRKEAVEFAKIVNWLNPKERHIHEKLVNVSVDFEDDDCEECDLGKEFLNFVAKAIAE